MNFECILDIKEPEINFSANVGKILSKLETVHISTHSYILTVQSATLFTLNTTRINYQILLL